MHVSERFLKYVSMDTMSDPSSSTFPSTAKQLKLAAVLKEEMEHMGLTEVTLDEYGYVFGTIPSTIENYQGKVIGFIAHMDTSPDASGADIKPRIIENYDGKDILLNGEKKIIMSIKDFPFLKDYTGKRLIVTDGTTLLGADDKAGVAEILTAAEYLMSHPEIPHGPVRIGFTPDEEVGGGADHFDVEKFHADFAYTIDGGAVGELEYENFNAAAAKVTITGVSIHPGSAKNKLVNAGLLAVEFENMMPAAQKPEYTEDREGFIHLHSMEGCVEQASMEYIIRDHDMELFEQKKLLMKNTADYMNQKYGAGTVSLEIKDSYYNMKEKIQPHMHLIHNAMAVYNSLGITPVIVPIRGGTDGARLSFMGLPCPNLGTGGHNFHGHYEFCCIESMEKEVEAIIELVKCYAVF